MAQKRIPLGTKIIISEDLCENVYNGVRVERAMLPLRGKVTTIIYAYNHPAVGYIYKIADGGDFWWNDQMFSVIQTNQTKIEVE